MSQDKKDQPCAFCRLYTVDKLNLGELHYCNDIRAHYYCVLLSATIKQSGADDEGIYGFVHADLVAELKTTKKRTCHYCGKTGAGLRCTQQTKTRMCDRYYHLPCGNQNGAMHNFLDYVSMCHTHAPKTNVPKRLLANISTIECIICRDNFDKNADVIFAECCNREVIMHTPCVRQYALNSGYHFRCPACNDRNTFLRVVRQCNVFVPDADTTWETEQTYSQMYETRLRCEAPECVCPIGRQCFRARGPWKSLICYTCGSSGVHQKCSGENVGRFVCVACTIEEDSEGGSDDGSDRSGDELSDSRAVAVPNTPNNDQNEPCVQTVVHEQRVQTVVHEQRVQTVVPERIESVRRSSRQSLSQKLREVQAKVVEAPSAPEAIAKVVKDDPKVDDDSDEDTYRNIIEIVDYSSDDDDDDDDEDDPLRGIPTLSPQVESHQYVQNQTFGPSTSYNSLKRSRPSSPDIKPLKAVKNDENNVKIIDFSSDDDADDVEFGDDEYKMYPDLYADLNYMRS